MKGRKRKLLIIVLIYFINPIVYSMIIWNFWNNKINHFSLFWRCNLYLNFFCRIWHIDKEVRLSTLEKEYLLMKKNVFCKHCRRECKCYVNTRWHELINANFAKAPPKNSSAFNVVFDVACGEPVVSYRPSAHPLVQTIFSCLLYSIHDFGRDRVKNASQPKFCLFLSFCLWFGF